MESVAELEREALQAAAAAPPDPSGPVPESPEPLSGTVVGPSEEEIFAGYDMICTEVISSGSAALIPAWQVTPQEVSRLSAACSRALMLWFPDMIIPPKYLALLTIAGVGFEIAQARKDPNTGRYQPARLPDPPRTVDQAQAPAAH